MFLNILNMQMPGDFEEDLYKVKANVLKCLTLMANKYDEDFEPYIEDFCKTVWELLSYTSGKYQYQKFISASLDYFRAVTLKPKISPLIEQNLTTLFTNLLMPNMILTDIEEELVIQSPADFVRMFLEDANDETQRNAATQLMKVLIKQFPVQVEGILSTMQTAVFSNFQGNRNAWKELDALIYLLSGAFYILYTPKHGVPDNGLIVPIDKIMSYYD